MKISALLCLGVALWMGAVPAVAQQFESVPQTKEASAAQASPTARIGVIKVREAMARTQEGRKAGEDMQAYFAPKQAELDKIRQDIANLENQLRTQERTLSNDARLQVARQIEQKRKEGERLQQDLNDEIEDKQADHINRIGEKMQRIINQYAQEKGLSLLFNIDAGSVVYAGPGVDITDDIVRRYDEAYPVTAASAAKPTAAPQRSSSPPKP